MFLHKRRFIFCKACGIAIKSVVLQTATEEKLLLSDTETDLLQGINQLLVDSWLREHAGHRDWIRNTESEKNGGGSKVSKVLLRLFC